jgi:putative transposase
LNRNGWPPFTGIYILSQLEEEVGLPKQIRCDNGPEFIAHSFKNWCKSKQIRIQYIQPGKPMQNGYIERFNRFFREDILDAYWFEDYQHLRILSENWRQDYNNNHPHKSLKGLAPCQFRSRVPRELAPEEKGKRHFWERAKQ